MLKRSRNKSALRKEIDALRRIQKNNNPNGAVGPFQRMMWKVQHEHKPKHPHALANFIAANRSFQIQPSRLPFPYASATWSGITPSSINIGHTTIFEDPPELETELEFSFSNEPIVAYRVWRPHQIHGAHKERTYMLGSYSADSVWAPLEKMNASVHLPHSHTAPWPHCSCGIWAFKTLHQTENISTPEMVVGSVYLWGRVLEFKKGFRAQYAYPKEIYVPEHYLRSPGELRLTGMQQHRRLYLDWLAENQSEKNIKRKFHIVQQLSEIYGIPLKKYPQIKVEALPE